MIRRRDDVAQLFMTGGSQAVRLPKEYRFRGTAVRIRREGNTVVLEPLEKASWPDGYFERLDAFAPLPDDFVAPEPLPPTPHRDRVFKEPRSRRSR